MRERAALIGATLAIENAGAEAGAGSGSRCRSTRWTARAFSRSTEPSDLTSWANTMTPLKTRILLADDHAVVRRGLRLVLDAEPDLEVVAETGDGAEAVQRALVTEIDLAILDISMPRMTGLQAARELHRRRPELRILMLSMHQNERYLYEALKAGAAGYVLKTVADRDLVEACRAAMRGERFLYPGRDDAADQRVPARRAQRRAGARGPADAARDRGRQADRRELQHQADRRRAHDQREDRRPPPREHPREARRCTTASS